jgi:formamidopyrimidine-DNA glycosylase
VPELPDLTIVAEALHAAVAGRPIVAAAAPGPLAVRGTPEELQALVGQAVAGVRRRGKFLVMELERDRVIVNPMLTGRFQLAAPKVRLPPKTAFILAFGPRTSAPASVAGWTTGASWMPADSARAELRYRDPTQMGKVYLLPAGIDREVAGFGSGELGPDADDPVLDLETWRARIRPFRGELKSLLRNQAFVAGIGNAYADEILHAARLLPTRRRSSLADEEIDELYHATRRVLGNAIAILRERVPPTFEVQVRDFLAVHLKGGTPCPRCGTRISEIKAGGFVTSFCRGCQH